MADFTYRKFVYERYYSAFKQRTLGPPNIDQAQEKLAPILGPWTQGIDRGSPAADLGCGDGRLIAVLIRLGFTNVAGCDLSAEQVALAKAFSPQIAVENILQFLARYPEEHFGLITLFDVLEHLTKNEIIEMLDAIRSRLQPGGVLIAHAPNGDSPFANSVFSADFTHETLLNPISAQTVCLLCGLGQFEVSEHLGASPGVKGRLRSLAWSLARCGIRAYNSIETGSAGSGIYTRNFAFRVRAGMKTP